MHHMVNSSEKPVKKRVFVGLSGGVDSAVSAALLLEAGYDVTGVFIKGWYPEGLPCTWASDRRDAIRVAVHLGIPFHTLDASLEYKRSVIDYLIREYGAGRTPNPDIFCNKEVKFGAFYRFAKEQGADYIATGHYAKTQDGRLYEASNEAKDQSYFLWAIPKEALHMTLFPLQDYTEKDEVRALALKFRLPVADKKDSQGICFLGPVSMDDFLKDAFSPTEGVAKDVDGNVLGTHQGAILSTLGERVSLTGAPPGPWYVLRKDLTLNELTVSHERLVSRDEPYISFTDANWFTELPTTTVSAQYRYHGPRVEGTVLGTRFTPTKPLPEPVASGQSIVFYTNHECIGGGIIA